MLTACATCADVDDEVAARFSGKPQELEAKCGDADRVHLRVGRSSGAESGLHVHVDIIQESQLVRFGRKKKPATNTEQEIQEALALFLGKAISVDVHARFVVRPNELPSDGFVAKQLGQAACVSGVNTLLMGQTFAVENRDLQWFSWGVEQDGVSITIHAECDAEMADSYLQELRDIAEKWMRTVSGEDRINER